jgi:hypothetical protein
MTAMPIAVALGGANLILLGLLARGEAAGPVPDVLRGRARAVDERGAFAPVSTWSRR